MSSDDASNLGLVSSGKEHLDPEEAIDPQSVARKITSTSFEDWYNKFQFRQNIRRGQEYFNGPPKEKPPGRFSPSDLLKCHRKTYYNHLNAAVESSDPDGIFYFGNRFEEELAEQFIEESVDTPGTYLQNSLWIRTNIETEVGPVTLVGSTDPVIVDKNGEPILLTEIKTTSSIEYTSKPKEHHLAQTHAYMYGLTEKYDRQIHDVVFLYAERDTLEAKTFHSTFDWEFWTGRVVNWMKENTFYRVFGFLPPAEPQHDWECKYCDYRDRCGQTSSLFEDEKAAGFLPLKTDYPREKVTEYLNAHPEAKLTPSLAHTYPNLIRDHGAYDWICSDCDATFPWDEINWNGEDTPPCPVCAREGKNGRLSGPPPAEQHRIEIVEQPEGDDQ